MNVIVRQPTGPLALFVDKLWYIQSDNLPLQGINLPIWHGELMINFSDHFSMQQPDEQLIVNDQISWLSGLQTVPSRSKTYGKHETMGALLKPWALYPLTGVPAFAFTDQAINSQDIIGSQMHQLIETLGEAYHGSDKLSALEQFLTSRYRTKDFPAYLFYADQYLQQQPFRDGIITDLCQTLRLSRKSLNESFQKYIGLSPSQYLRLLRFLSTIETIVANPTRKLTDIAYQHHFFDQAHFIHLFKTFAHMTPGDYQSLVQAGQATPFMSTGEPYSPWFIREAT